MREFAEKRRKKQIFHSTPVLIILLILLAIMIKANISIYSKVRESGDRREQIGIELQELNERKIKLEEEVMRLNSEIGVEEELRNRFNLMKENEEMIVILEEERREIDQDLQKNKKTLFQKIKGWFTN